MGFLARKRAILPVSMRKSELFTKKFGISAWEVRRAASGKRPSISQSQPAAERKPSHCRQMKWKCHSACAALRWSSDKKTQFDELRLRADPWLQALPARRSRPECRCSAQRTAGLDIVQRSRRRSPPALRLALCARVVSTRMRRIASAAAAKKCPRLFHGRRRSAPLTLHQTHIGLVPPGPSPAAFDPATPGPIVEPQSGEARHKPAATVVSVACESPCSMATECACFAHDE